MASKKIDRLSFDATLEELETIVHQLEQGSLPLEEALHEPGENAADGDRVEPRGVGRSVQELGGALVLHRRRVDAGEHSPTHSTSVAQATGHRTGVDAADSHDPLGDQCVIE